MCNLMRNEYVYNLNFKKYVDEYCKTHKCTIEEAFEHPNVRQIFLYFTDV